jgi:hypothetical protein
MEFDIDRAQSTRMEDQHRVHMWFLASLDRINRAMQGTNDLERMVTEVLDAVLDIFECDRAWLCHPCDPDAPTWRLVVERSRPGYANDIQPGGEMVSTPAVAEMMRLARQMTGSVLFGSHHEYALSADSLKRFRVRAQILMALYPKAERPYVFGLHQCSRERAWSLQEQRLFEEIGHRLEDALTSLLIFRNLRESERALDEAQRMAHVGHWDRDFFAGTIELSVECGRIFGLGRDGPVSLPQWNEVWLKLIHAEDRAAGSRRGRSRTRRGAGVRRGISHHPSGRRGALRAQPWRGDARRVGPAAAHVRDDAGHHRVAAGGVRTADGRDALSDVRGSRHRCAVRA